MRRPIRKLLSPRIKDEINAEYEHRCAYCCLKLGSVVKRKARLIVLDANYDHFVPFSYGESNYRFNYVLSCNVCNELKSTDIYDSIQDVTNGIAKAREKYLLVWETPVAVTEDMHAWAVKYASWLASARDGTD